MLKEILALPKPEQIAIVQAILSAWKEEAEAERALLSAQTDFAKSVAKKYEAGEEPTYTLHDLQAEMKKRKK